MSKLRWTHILLTIFAVLLGAILRFSFRNWDQGNHFHPDERFLTMVTLALQPTASWKEYLDPAVSTLNPMNLEYSFFVYGTFPLVFVKFLAQHYDMHTYELLTLFGRSLSALLDTGVMFLLFLFTWILEKKYKLPTLTKVFAVLAYALSVLPIQLSHFFTTDPYAHFFTFLAVTCLAFYSWQRNWWGRGAVIVAGIAWGIAIGSKVSAIYFAPLLGWFLAEPVVESLFTHQKRVRLPFEITKFLSLGLLFAVSSYLALRIASPIYFASGNMLDFTPNEKFSANIEELKNFSGDEVWYPPAIQWINKTPLLFPLKNTMLVGLGVPLFVYTCLGLVMLSRYSLQEWKKRLTISVMVLWLVGIFVYHGIQFVTTMRYFWPLYPFFALAGGYFLAVIFSHQLKNKAWRPFFTGVKVGAVMLLFIWPAMFMSIYQYPHSRVQASAWIYQNIPETSVLATEHWDDGLPVYVDIPEAMGKQYKGLQVPVFYPDDEKKWVEINEVFSQADYYLLTSNRAWGSISTVPEKYPLMSRFYDDLFAGRLQFEKVADFTSYPSLHYLGIPLQFSTDWVEEAFSVYDHPRVMIFRKLPEVSERE